MAGGRPLKRKSLADHVDEALRRIEQVERRYDPPRGHYAIKCFADRNALDGNLPDEAIVVSLGDGKFLWPIPPDLDETKLVLAEAGVSLAGAGDTEIMLGNCGTDPTSFPGTDMLLAPITIDAGDFVSFTPGSKFGTTDIDPDEDEVQSGDWMSINVINDGDGAEGLVIMVNFLGQAL